MANIAYKYRLTPTESQEKLLSQLAGATRWIWNYMLDLNKKQYAIDKKFVFSYNMHKLLPDLKKTHEWLKLSPSQSLQHACVDLDRALQSVWKSKFGFPKFKSKHKSKDSFRVPQTNEHIKITDTYIKIPKIGPVKWNYHRPINGVVKSITVSKDINHWYVSVLVETLDVQITPIDPTKCNAIGIDLGIKSFFIDNNNNKISSPNFLKQKLARLKRYQRRVSRKCKGSKNRDRARIKLAKWHRGIRNARADWLHKLSNKLVNDYDLICVEDLKIKSLMKRKYQKSLNRAISDQGWGTFLLMLKYKSQQQGKTLTQIDQYAPSSKACSCCGHVMSKMTLNIREWQCPSCRTLHDRDTNAANNILIWGIMATQNTLGTREINACGDTSADMSNQYRISAKQEATGPLGL